MHQFNIFFLLDGATKSVTNHVKLQRLWNLTALEDESRYFQNSYSIKVKINEKLLAGLSG